MLNTITRSTIMKRTIPLHFMLFLVTIIAMTMTTVSANVVGAEAAKPVSFHTIVDLKFVQQYAVIPKRNDVVIIDARPKARKYDKGHIPTAISIPDREFDKHTAMLPKDKSTLLIFYCGGQKCKLSHKSAFKAEKLGYTNVKVFADGYPAWVKGGNIASVSTQYVKKLIDKGGKAVIIDSRPKKRKYDKGHIPGAISIPTRKFDDHASKLPEDKKTPLVFYCGGPKCTLSPKAAVKAKALGYTNVKTYTAGFPAWKKAYPDQIAKAGSKQAKKVAIKAGKEEGSISVASFKKVLEENPNSVMLVDVRDKAIFKQGSFKTAVNIPIDDLEKKLDSLPKDKPIIFFCNSGGMAGEAYDLVNMLGSGFKIYYVEAEISFNKDGSYTIKPLSA